MKKLFMAAALSATALGTSVYADGHGITVGVSWSNFQEERWKTDEAAHTESIVQQHRRLKPTIRISLQQKIRQRWDEEALLSEPHWLFLPPRQVSVLY
jgi:ABC-type xylose transport system substrate-binding protein